MKKLVLSFSLLVFGLLALWALYPRSPSPKKSVPLTFVQVSAGTALYGQHCASCHGPELEGTELTPSLTGDRFEERWAGKSLDKLMFHLKRMPPRLENSPVLDDEAYANIMAYILIINGTPASETKLPSDIKSLAEIEIPQRNIFFDFPAVKEDKSGLLNRLRPVTSEMLRLPPKGDWLQWGGGYDGLNFSRLQGINRKNVQNLRPVWRVPLRDGSNMPTPLVHDGVMFLQTAPDTLLAIDASNGNILWKYHYRPEVEPNKRMGIALYGDRAFMPTSDAHVLAINAKTGTLIWDHEILEDRIHKPGQLKLRSAPLIVKDKVIQGVTSGLPGGAFISGLDIKTGQEVWRFHTIARPGEPGGDTWNGLPLLKRSGGSVWHQGTYDSELNLVYFGVAPTYDTGPLLHPSKDKKVNSNALYTDCTIALNPETGKLVWYYQHLANDQWDLDWAFERQIVHLTIDGKRRKVVMNMGKLGILDALDAATGKYLFSIDSGIQTIVTHIDKATGKKTIDPNTLPNPNRPTVFCPGTFGARSWPPSSFNPLTETLYLPLAKLCSVFGPDGPKLMTSGTGVDVAEHPESTDGTLGRLLAIDVKGRRPAWVHNQPSPITTSTLATASGLLFVGDLDPALKAFDATNGKLLWKAELDDFPSSSILSYSVGKTQYVAVVVGLHNQWADDLSRAYDWFLDKKGKGESNKPNGGAAIWVFSL